MPTFLTAGVVLKKEDYKDYDRKLTIYTLGHGKITVLAKGAKKITSKLNSHLEFFSVTKLMVANSSTVKRLAGAQLVKKYISLSSNITKNIIALYFLEVLNSLVKYDFKRIDWRGRLPIHFAAEKGNVALISFSLLVRK